MNWKRIKNGELLELAEPQFDLLLTLRSEPALPAKPRRRTIAILELSTNKLRRLEASAEVIPNTLGQCNQESFEDWRFPDRSGFEINRANGNGADRDEAT